MFRPYSSSAGAHFVKPVLEALEDRVVPSGLGDALWNIGSMINGHFHGFPEAARQLREDAQNGHPGDLNNVKQLQQDLANVASEANLLQQRSDLFTSLIFQGLQSGLLDPREAGVLLDQAVALSQNAADAQEQLLEDQNIVVLATVDCWLNSVGSTDLASNGFDFNGLASDVVGGAFGGGFFI